MNQESCRHEKHSAKKTTLNILTYYSGNHSYQLLIYALGCAALALLMTLSLSAQDQSADTRAKKVVAQADKQGFPLNATLNVRDNASVEAVLIPPKLAQKVFGKTVGNDYAVISLTISNRSPQAALIIDTIFIDYSRWLLSGGSPPPNSERCAEQEQENATAQKQGQTAGTTKSPADASKTNPAPGNRIEPWQTATCPNQIASVEYRIVRDQLQHDQPYTWRNWVIRSLELTGSIAGAATFSIGSKHAVQAISAYAGTGIPAARTFWPDDTVGQLNNISDLAFRVNKVIPKESSDIVVAFFPIDRFITPGFKKWFIQSPALFFSPYAMLLDPKSPQRFRDLIEKMAPGAISLLEQNTQYLASSTCDSEDNVRQLIKREQILDERAQADIFRACRVGKLLQAASLNTVRIMVGGTMTVDVNNVPAKIDSIEITTTDNKAVTSWAKAQDLIGVIRGTFLSNGQPVVVNGDQLGITNVAAVTEGSTDKELHFKMSQTKAISESTLTFKIVKKTATGANVESATYNYPLQNQVPVPHISDTSRCTATDNKKTLNCTIQGTSLSGVDIQIENAEALGKPTITSKKTIDTELQIEVSFTNPLAQAVTFVAVKGTGSERVESNMWEYKP